jgi:Protein of unknown function (DUF664)
VADEQVASRADKVCWGWIVPTARAESILADAPNESVEGPELDIELPREVGVREDELLDLRRRHALRLEDKRGRRTPPSRSALNAPCAYTRVACAREGVDDSRMEPGDRVAQATLESARRMFLDNVSGISLEEALDSGGGLRSILGLIKHTAACLAVYHSFAFDDVPRSWTETDWPGGLRERIEPTEVYVHEVLGWFERNSTRWLDSVNEPIDLEEPARCTGVRRGRFARSSPTSRALGLPRGRDQPDPRGRTR